MNWPDNEQTFFRVRFTRRKRRAYHRLRRRRAVNGPGGIAVYDVPGGGKPLHFFYPIPLIALAINSSDFSIGSNGL